MTTPLRRATVVWLVTASAQTLAFAGLTRALALRGSAFETALLFLATALLAGVWALRRHLTDAGEPSLYAAMVPIVAVGLSLTPALVRGSAPEAWLTLAIAAMAAAPVQRVWSSWVTQRPTPPAGFALAVLAPVVGIIAVTLATSQEPVVLAAAAVSGAVGLAAAARAARRAVIMRGELRRTIELIDAIEVYPDALVIPESPGELVDPWLRELYGNLRRRSDELGEDADVARRARFEIERARQLRSRFMASMSHDLRSPLNSIIGFGEMLEEGIEGELGEAQLESVSMITRSARELRLLLSDTLDLARLEAGALRLRRAWVPSVEILTEAVARCRALVEGREVEVEAQLQPGLPPVHVDAQRIVQSVVALFRSTTPSLKGATVRLRARLAAGPPGPERQLRVEFYDAVGALPEREVERIFEAFQELTAPAGRPVGGLGMALSLARSLVRLHGGDVWADSVPGAGSVLCVALPLDETEAE